MTLEWFDFLKLPKHKPHNYSISSECHKIFNSVTDMKYIIWICSFKFEFAIIYINNDAQIIIGVFIKKNNGLGAWRKYTLCDGIYAKSLVQRINIIFHQTIKYNVNSILDIAVCDTDDISKCLSDVGIIDVLSNIISSYLSFSVSMYNIQPTDTKCKIFNKSNK